MNTDFNLSKTTSNTSLTSSTSAIPTSQPVNTSPRAINSRTSIQGFNIFNRELTISPDPSNTYASQVIELAREYFLIVIEYLNKTVQPKDGRDKLIDVDQLNTLEDMASAIMSALSFISKLGYFPMFRSVLNILGTKFIELKISDSKFDSDTVSNAMASCSILFNLFQKLDDYRDQWALLSQVDLKNLKDSVISLKFTDIDFAIQKLEQFKTEIYLPMFSLVTDPSQNLKSKSLFCKNYIGENLDQSKDDYVFIQDHILNGIINDSLCDLIQLQIVLDCLKLIKKAPKSRQNLNLLSDIFKKYFESIQKDITIIGINKIANLENTPYGQNQSEIFRFLKQFNRLLEQDLHQFNVVNVVPKIQQDDWADNPMMRDFNKSKSKAQQSRRVKGKKKNKGTRQKTPTSKPASKIENTTVTPQLPEPKPSVTEVLLQNSIVTPVQPLSQPTPSNPENSDDDSIDTIERETNEFMEVFRQFLESDRRQKLERKEAKTKQVEVVSETEIETETHATEIKSEPIKLGKKRQTTLDLLFQQPTPHLQITGESVKLLIERLGGRSVGAGEATKFGIFWGISQKQAGKYKIAHEGDANGYLTSYWAQRVVDAINVGVQVGHISPELIPGHSQEEKK